MPFGLPSWDAILATDLEFPPPTVMFSPTAVLTCSFTYRASPRGLAPEATRWPTSRYASSMDRGSTSGVSSRKMSMIRADTSAYRGKRGLTRMTSGHSRSACPMGMAECTPKARAS